MFLWNKKLVRLLIAAACLFQEADDSEADTSLSETPAGQELMPILRMLRYENFFLADSPDMMKIYSVYLLSKGYLRSIPFYCSSGKKIYWV